MMRYVRNEEQKPHKLLSPDQRRSIWYKLLVLGIVITAIGTLGFFLAFIYREVIAQQGLNFRDFQTYAIAVGFVGVLFYMISALKLDIGLKDTTYYKIRSLVRDDLFDPPVKGDHSRHILTRLEKFDDRWALYTQIAPDGESKDAINYVVIGPSGVYSLHVSPVPPDHRKFKDPAPALAEQSELLAEQLGVEVTPLILFLTNPAAYRGKSEVRSFELKKLHKWLKQRSPELSVVEQQRYEERLYGMIRA